MSATLILTLVSLLFLLVALVSLYVWRSRSKAASAVAESAPETFETYEALIRNPSSGPQDLERAVRGILERFAHIDSSRLSRYRTLIMHLCTHPRTDSKLILAFEKGLRAANEKYAHEIEKALGEGLAARS